MTKTKKQLRAEAVERLKNCVAARFDAESIIIALTSGRRGQSDWSLECDKLIYLLTDDSNDDSTPEKVVSGSKPCVTPESCRQYADQRKQGDYADCESCDSREKLEADVYRAADEMDRFYCGEKFIDTRKIIGWLDRQAAITERECRKPNWDYCETCETLAELTAERDNLKANNEQLHTLAGEQAAKIDELQSAFDAICANLSIIANGEPDMLADIAIETIDALIDECNTANRQCNEYREKFGKCLDYADAIHALMDDEGMA